MFVQLVSNNEIVTIGSATMKETRENVLEVFATFLHLYICSFLLVVVAYRSVMTSGQSISHYN